MYFFVAKQMRNIEIKKLSFGIKAAEWWAYSPPGLVSFFSFKRDESLKFMNYVGKHKLNKKSEEETLKMLKDETREDFSTNSRKLKSWFWAEAMEWKALCCRKRH